MNELETQIAKIVNDLIRRATLVGLGELSELRDNEDTDTADEILSSPTNLRAERECACGIWLNKGQTLPDCPLCHGSSIISRPLTLQEVVEAMRELLTNGSDSFWQYGNGVHAKRYIKLPSGERIVIARDKEE